jgi:antitoxin component of MazEF toxin-antitoxin module
MDDDRTFEARLQKIDNSLCIVIPTKILKDFCLSEGDIVSVRIHSTSLEKRNKTLLELAGVDKNKPAFTREKEDR